MDYKANSSGSAVQLNLSRQLPCHSKKVDLSRQLASVLSLDSPSNGASKTSGADLILTFGPGKSSKISSPSSLSLKDMLEEAILSLSVEVDDGSIEEIVEKLMLMHEECLEGNFSSIQRLRETNLPKGAMANVGQAVDSSDDEDDIEDNNENMVVGSLEMEVDANTSHSIPNSKERTTEETKPDQSADVEDGWTKVGPRQNKGRRN